MAVFELPLKSINQLFNADLGGISYHMRLMWDDVVEGVWVLDISDQEDNPLIFGIPLIAGADLLAQYQYLNIGNGGYLYCYTDGQPMLPPTRDNLGGNSHLLWQPYD